jgi:hypothetical protein
MHTEMNTVRERRSATRPNSAVPVQHSGNPSAGPYCMESVTVHCLCTPSSPIASTTMPLTRVTRRLITRLLRNSTHHCCRRSQHVPAVCTCKPWRGHHRCMRRPNAMLAKMSTNAKLEKMRPTAVAPTPCRAASCGKMGDAIENVVLTVMRHASTAAKDHLQQSTPVSGLKSDTVRHLEISKLAQSPGL